MVSPSTSGCTTSDWPAGPSGLIQRTRPTRPAAPDHERSIAPPNGRRATGGGPRRATRRWPLSPPTRGRCRWRRRDGIWRPPPFDVRADNRADDQALKHVHGRSPIARAAKTTQAAKTERISRRRRSISSRSLSICGPLTLISSGRAPSFSVGEIIQRDKRHGRVGSR